MEGGQQNNNEGFDAGTQYGFIVTFKSAADRDYFVTKDPAPAEFRAFNKYVYHSPACFLVWIISS
jgi:hypothetical protein